MRIRAGSSLLLPLVLGLAGCRRGPSREEALVAIRAAQHPGDTGMAIGRVWQDGPPWFSCAEVLTKIGTGADSATVRTEVGNWKGLVVAGLIVLRDSAEGKVSDPGWCTARLTPAGDQRVRAWRPAPGDSFPTGALRRGWLVNLGSRHLSVLRTHSAGEDSATADYAWTIATNADGMALGAARDTTRFVATLRRRDGSWRMLSARRATGR